MNRNAEQPKVIKCESTNHLASHNKRNVVAIKGDARREKLIEEGIDPRRTGEGEDQRKCVGH
jgi:hypothetical protein